MKKSHLLTASVFIGLLPSLGVLAEEQEKTWVDEQHQEIRTKLRSWAHTLDEWMGEPDPEQPATAGLRIMLDSQWNHYDHFSVKPRVRGKIRLPTLKKQLSLVFGDEDLDNESRDKNHIGKVYSQPLNKNKHYDRRQTREDNASVGLRWSDYIKKLGIDTDIDLGIRSGSDIYLRFRVGKEWFITERFSTRLEQIYRYGSNSKHYLRTNFENKYRTSDNTFIANQLYLQSEHDVDERNSWGNSFYRQHDFNNYKRLNYGIFIGGDIENKKFHINQYGPFISWRQPILRQWFFIQPELNYYNDKKQGRSHHVGAFLRLEAIF
ncbi:hypothetical protein [Aggregatibacter kilianii]|uniref:hypothetical protein n=1 Tax=Aggregatibacter kilianii TaxID=2025884 RepID=UPI000D65D312|nr:hypothetical protein [Aggregatibacter kilianii]RDE87533.1 hypothetical protein DPV90_00465 [Aggregatibacter aphrophilus]